MVFLRRTLMLLVIVSCLFCSEVNAADKPNVIIILADDMGFSDIGCYGGEIETPNIDALAAGGVKFTQFYNTARCCPTRASLMTGLHPAETGIGHMTCAPGEVKMYKEPCPAYQGYLNKNCVTIAEALKGSGYATLMTGKWHLGFNDKGRWPLQRGFEKYFGCIAGATKFFYPEYPRGMMLGNTDIIRNPESTTDRRFYTTDAFTDYAIKFIDEEKAAKDRPFFLYLAYTSPHWPLQAHQEEVAKYKGKYMMGWNKLREQRYKKQIELGLIDPKWKLSEQDGPDWDEMDENKKKDMELRMANFAAMVDRMDQNIGKLVSYLKKTGEYDNTLILFLSDNGGCAEGGELAGNTDPFDLQKWESVYGPGPSYGKVWANASNTPFLKYKHFTHEGGISTPLIAHWPEKIKKTGVWYREPAYLIDLMPTVLDVAKWKYPKKYKEYDIQEADGVSLLPALAGKSLKRGKPLFWEHENNAAMLDGDWKLVGTHVSKQNGPDASKWELYNLKEDRTEQNNLAGQMPEKVKKMAEQWYEWAVDAKVYPKPKNR